MFNEKKELEIAIEKAFKDLYEYDKYLIVNAGEDKHVSERGIVFRFGVYLQKYLLKHFSDYNLDTEYNREGYEIKKLPSFENGVYPDLILHKRGNHDNNLLVMEFKTWWNKDTKEDEQKIKEFMSKSGKYKYKYKYGAVVKLGKNEPVCEFKEETNEQLEKS